MGIWKRIHKNYDDTIASQKDQLETGEPEEQLSSQMEKNDFLAMWISAVFTLLLPAAAFLIILCLLVFWIFF